MTFRRGVCFVVFAAMTLPVSVQAFQLQQGADEDQRDDPRARQQYLERIRRGGTEDGYQPSGARLRALEEMDQMLADEARAYWSAAGKDGAISGSTANSSQWLFIGPMPSSAGSFASSGRTTAMVVDPRDATGNTAYIGAAQGGVWKTTDGGTNWTPLTDSQPSLAVGSMAIDGSTNPSTVYVGTGEQSFSGDSYYGAGILRSTDGGTTWSQLGASTFAGPVSGCSGGGTACGGAFIGGLSIRPGTPSTLLAAVSLLFGNDGVYRSIDSGTTWTRVSTGVSAVASSVQYATANIAYAGMNGNGVWKSIDGGATWNAANGTGANVITTASTGRVELSVALSDATGGTVYASVAASNGNLSGFYKTTDGGTNWTKIASFDATNNPNGLRDYCNPQCWYDNIVAVNPTNANVVFVGGSAVQGFISKSVDGGTTWTTATATGGIHVDEHAAAFSASANVLYFGNDGGVWKTTDTGTSPTGATWVNLNNTLGTTQFYSYFALHPTSVNTTIAGTQDNNTQKYDGTQTLNAAWTRVTCGDGASGVIDAFNPNLVYANCQRIQILKSSSGGGSGYGTAQTGIATDDAVDFIPPMVGDLNPDAQNNVYFGTFRVYQSKNALSSWSVVSGDISGTGSTISYMTVAPSDRGALYVGTNNGKIGRGAGLNTLDCAASLTCFTDVTGTGLPSRRISGIGVSYSDPNRVYVTIAGFGSGESQGNSKKVFRSTTGGTNWTNISSNLPNVIVNDIVVDPDLASTLYVGTDIGVFRSTDDGASWSTLANGFPRVAVYGLKLHRPTRILRAATHGRGFWDLYVPTTASPVLTITPAAKNLGTQTLNQTTASQSVTLTALNGDVTGLSVGTATGDFARTNNCASTLAANATCTIGITFTPTAPGARTGAVSITSSGSGSPQTLNLAGTGLDPSTLLPDNVTFSAVVGRTSPAQTVTFSNNSGSSVVVSSVTVPINYTRTHNCTTVANGASCTINVTFAPTGAGAANGSVAVTHSGPSSPKSISVSGTGVDFTLSLSRPARPSRTASSSIVIEQGQAAVIDLMLGATDYADDYVDLECVGAPRNATCSVTPARVPLSGVQAVQVRVQTTAPRSARLERNSGTPAGPHQLRVVARLGSAAKRIDIPITVVRPSRAN